MAPGLAADDSTEMENDLAVFQVDHHGAIGQGAMLQ
jgi:hypothetical protein